MVGGWSKDQIGYINRNTNLFYHRPEIITEIIKQGKRERKGKFWIANLIKSNKAREEFERAGSPGSALDPNAIFFKDEENPGAILQGGQIQRALDNVGSGNLNFLDFINQQSDAPTFNVPSPTPTPSRSMTGPAGDFEFS